MLRWLRLLRCWSQLYVNVTPELKAESAHLTTAAVVLGVDNMRLPTT
ncbi:hypothetical protein [Stygiolobus azoricus]|nr:hypothetical protein [Stygiolobus azoricus]